MTDCERGLFAYCKSFKFRCRCLFNTQGPIEIFSKDRRGQQIPPFEYPSTLFQVTSISQKGDCANVRHQFLWMPPRRCPLIACLWWPVELTFAGPIGLKQTEEEFLTGYPPNSCPKSQCRGSRIKCAQCFCGRGQSTYLKASA